MKHFRMFGIAALVLASIRMATDYAFALIDRGLCAIDRLFTDARQRFEIDTGYDERSVSLTGHTGLDRSLLQSLRHEAGTHRRGAVRNI